MKTDAADSPTGTEEPLLKCSCLRLPFGSGNAAVSEHMNSLVSFVLSFLNQMKPILNGETNQ